MQIFLHFLHDFMILFAGVKIILYLCTQFVVIGSNRSEWGAKGFVYMGMISV